MKHAILAALLVAGCTQTNQETVTKDVAPVAPVVEGAVQQPVVTPGTDTQVTTGTTGTTTTTTTETTPAVTDKSSNNTSAQ